MHLEGTLMFGDHAGAATVGAICRIVPSIAAAPRSAAR